MTDWRFDHDLVIGGLRAADRVGPSRGAVCAPRTTEEIKGHPNEAVVRKGYAAFSRGDIETLQNEIFTDDIVWHVPGRNRFSGDYKGISEVRGYFGQLG